VATDDKKIKPYPAPKTNAPSKDGSTTDKALPKAESGEKASDSSSGYSSPAAPTVELQQPSTIGRLSTSRCHAT
jgi:hypothetical protein